MAVLAALLVIQVLFVSTMAQMPAPMMPDTFQGSGEIELHAAESTTFGKCTYPFIVTLARDQIGEKGYERDEYESENRLYIDETVLRYDSNMTYYLRGDEADRLHCIREERNVNGMPKFWAWLSGAAYEGITTVREIDYDTWATNIGGVRFEFGKPKTNGSITFFYRRKTTETSVFYSFMEFLATPDPNLFNVPLECKESK